MGDERYFNFPIQLLEGFMDNKNEVLNHIWCYSLYVISKKYEFGDEAEMIASAKSFLGVQCGDDNWDIYEKGEQLYDSIPMSSPIVGIKKDIYFDYCLNDKTDFQKLCLLGFLALRSILGDKTYCKVTNNFMWARMDGKVNAVKSKDELTPRLKSFANDYRTRKIKDELYDKWNLKTYAYYTRGFYVSFKLDIDQLVFYVEKGKKITKEKKRKEEFKNARLKALNKLL